MKFVLGIDIKGILMKLAAENVVVQLGQMSIRRRTSIEFHNPLWPFGVAYVKTTKPTHKRNEIEVNGRILLFFNITITIFFSEIFSDEFYLCI